MAVPLTPRLYNSLIGSQCTVIIHHLDLRLVYGKIEVQGIKQVGDYM